MNGVKIEVAFGATFNLSKQSVPVCLRKDNLTDQLLFDSLLSIPVSTKCSFSYILIGDNNIVNWESVESRTGTWQAKMKLKGLPTTLAKVVFFKGKFNNRIELESLSDRQKANAKFMIKLGKTI